MTNKQYSQMTKKERIAEFQLARVEIKRVKANLLRIQTTGSAPINLTFYKNQGLITLVHKTVTLPCGNNEQRLDRLQLTEKGKRILNSPVFI